jgi:hypothetical protein
VPLLEAPREELGTARGNRRERLVGNTREGKRAGARFVEDRQRARGGPGAPGYQPIITIIADGVTNTANAVVSGDRRYVRMTLVPTFSTLTDVQTFSFISAAGSNPNTTQAAGGGAGTGR